MNSQNRRLLDPVTDRTRCRVFMPRLCSNRRKAERTTTLEFFFLYGYVTCVTFLFTAYDGGRGSRSVRFYLRTTRGAAGRTDTVRRPKTMPEIKNIISTSHDRSACCVKRRVTDCDKRSRAAPRTDWTRNRPPVSETCFPRSFRTVLLGFGPRNNKKKTPGS